MALSEQIQALERTFACRICIHDHTKVLEPVTGTGYRTHLDPFCSLIKKKEDYKLHRCMYCDVEYLAQVLSKTPRPLLKLCHARVCEAVVPIMDGDRMIGTIYAGPFRAESEDLERQLLDSPSPLSRLNRQERKLREGLPVLTPEAAGNCLQLSELLADHLAGLARAGIKAGGQSAGRKERILNFVESNYPRLIGLQDLADHMGLSSSRTTQVVKETFGESFPSLCSRIRIEHACTMLARSYFSVTQIAQATGFGHQAYFHRVFKKEKGMTPLQYRKENFAIVIP